jgi:L,D-peptidoglycan transpeptidase YkuD (ErfK/YbiS/YcfS/YnhG family)
MRITVTADPADSGKARGRLRFAGADRACALGRGGIRAGKREGDGATPAGRFALRRVLYRADRMPAPATALPARALAPADAWCDDPAHPAYNTEVRLPFEGRAERLWREDRLYDLVIVFGHNDDPVVAGAGSAVFLHVAGDDLAPTEGCVATDRATLAALLARAAPGDVIEIVAPEEGR